MRADLAPATSRRFRRRAERKRRNPRAPQLVDLKPQGKDFPSRENGSTRLSRHAHPMQWPGVGRFSDDQLSQVDLVRIAKTSPAILNLCARADYSQPSGRPRLAGDWPLVFLAYTHSGVVDVEPWLRDSDPLMWWEAGFTRRPRYETVRNRFLELEALAIEEFFEASAELIRLAIAETGGRVAFDLSIDCTEAETNARLHHDCGPDDNCPGWGRKRKDRHGRVLKEGADNGQQQDDETTERESGLAAKAPIEQATGDRHARSEEPLVEGEEEQDLRGDVESVDLLDDGTVRVKTANHYWRLLDPTAGVRAYTGPKGATSFWAGFYDLKVSCHTFGKTIVQLVEAADETECSLFPDALERVLRICGEGHVRSMNADKGFATKPVCQSLVEHGITPVMPLRSYRGEDEKPPDRELFDRDGVPRCKHCGGDTVFVRFAKSPKPRLWFKCAKPSTRCVDKNGQPKQQTIYCSVDPRYLIPLWRTTPAWQALSHLGLSHERTHHLGRVRHKSAGKNYDSRPKRIGRDWQQLRANAAVTVTWLKIAWRMGWLPESFLRNNEQPYLQDGTEFAARISAYRRAEGLTRRYGPAAQALDPDAPLWLERRHIIDPDSGAIADAATGEIYALFDPEAGAYYHPLSDDTIVESEPAANGKSPEPRSEPPAEAPPPDPPPVKPAEPPDGYDPDRPF